jgi:hypothetical protein
VVVIDPHACSAAAVRAVLPDAAIAVDHFHLVMLANKTGSPRRANASAAISWSAAAARPPHVGQPAGAVARPRAPVAGGAGTDVERLRGPRPDRADAARVDRERRNSGRSARPPPPARPPRGHQRRLWASYPRCRRRHP